MSKRKKNIFYLIDLESQEFFANIPTRDQNHVVHGKNVEGFVGFFY